MTKKKKIWLFTAGIIGIIVISLTAAYFIYGSTLLNGYSEETIINSLSEDKDNSVEILIMKKYENHLLVTYKDPKDDDPFGDYGYFTHYIRHPLYKNRYYDPCRSYNPDGIREGGNFTGPFALSLNQTEIDNLKVSYLIGDAIARNDNRIIVYESDGMGNTVRKLEELEVPPNEPYIFVKEYELLNIFHDIDVCIASRDYPREYNENYLEADKELFNSIMNGSDEKYRRKKKQDYEKVFGEKYEEE